MRCWGLFVKTDDKMVLFSALGRRYNDSPKAIYEYMIQQPRFKGYRMVWALEDLNTEIPGNPMKVKADSLNEISVAGNLGRYDKRYVASEKFGKFGEMISIIRHSSHLLIHYPSDAIMAPVWYAWHKCWMLKNK
jgi:hypothetical protein